MNTVCISGEVHHSNWKSTLKLMFPFQCKCLYETSSSSHLTSKDCKTEKCQGDQNKCYQNRRMNETLSCYIMHIKPVEFRNNSTTEIRLFLNSEDPSQTPGPKSCIDVYLTLPD